MGAILKLDKFKYCLAINNKFFYNFIYLYKIIVILYSQQISSIYTKHNIESKVLKIIWFKNTDHCLFKINYFIYVIIIISNDYEDE